MASNIDPTKPVLGNPTTQSVRDNFSTAKAEIEALQQKDQDIEDGLGTMSVQDADNVNITGGSITGVSGVQPASARLDDIAALTPDDGNIIVGNGTNWTAESGATARTSLGVAIGSDVQAWDADLDSLSLGITGQTEEITPDDADVFLMQRASDGLYRKVQASNLPGAPSNVVTPEDFGAAGDGDGAGGGTNDAVALQDALDAAGAGGVLDLVGKTYRCDSALVLSSDVSILGGRIDGSNIAADTTLLTLSGTSDAPISLTADALQDSNTITVADASSIAPLDWIFISSDKAWDNNGRTIGEWAHVESVAANTITIRRELFLGYATVDNAKIEKINFASRFRMRDVQAIGGGPGLSQRFLDLQFVYDAVIDRCSAVDFDERCIEFERCVFGRVLNGDYSETTEAGLSYGVAIVDGCEDILVQGNNFRNMRHGVTIGGLGGLSHSIRAYHNHCIEMRDAGLDSHALGFDVDFSHNTVDHNAVNEDVPDGIISQGPRFIAIGNRVRGFSARGIRHQASQIIGDTSIETQTIIAGNDIFGLSASHGVEVGQNSSCDVRMRNVVVSNNTISGVDTGILIRRNGTGSLDIIDVNITGNNIKSCLVNGIQVSCAGTGTVTRGVIANNVLSMSGSATAAISMVGQVSETISNIAVTGNFVQNGATGILGTNTDYIATVGNITRGTPTPISVVGANSISANNIASAS